MIEQRKQKASAKLTVKDAFQFLKELQPNSVDLLVSSPPYFMGKEYDTSLRVEDFVECHKRLLPLLFRALKPGGSLCWQVGHHVRNGVVTPLDALVYSVFGTEADLHLRNRIIWTFGHGAHAKTRFSGRHETVLWYSKGMKSYFDLDAVRVRQKYPGKRHYKGPKKGEWSGNPSGKNPSDVWDIPNVKAGHIEKMDHPCQFPVALVQRLVRALCPPGGLVVDPFMGVGSSAVAAILEERHFSGCDTSKAYVATALGRIGKLRAGKLQVRPLNKPVYTPSGREKVSIMPPHFNS
ncbi:site-specific DNA-methyltransferase [soil metagenome]